MEINIDKMAHNVAEKALDEFLYQGKSIREWMQIIASEDAISRQAVFEMAYDMSEIDGEHFTDPYMVVDVKDIQKLLPVTSQLKTGHWIDDKCSVCGKGIENLIDSREWYRNEKPKFCPFCGIPLEWESED